jgi:gamma-glutamyltranspeptidase/glutathione hydrolase
VDYGLDVQSAADSPRWYHEGSSQSMGEDAPNLGSHGRLNLESGVPEETRKALEAIGWKIGEATGSFGRYEGIEHRMQGDVRVYAAGSEMRADAVALAY